MSGLRNVGWGRFGWPGRKRRLAKAESYAQELLAAYGDTLHTEETHVKKTLKILSANHDTVDLGMADGLPYALLWVDEESPRSQAGIFLGPAELRTLSAKALELADELEKNNE